MTALIQTWPARTPCYVIAVPMTLLELHEQILVRTVLETLVVPCASLYSTSFK